MSASIERLLTQQYNETAMEHLARYAFCMDAVARKKVLDVACGEGYGTNALSMQAASVTGVDIDAGTILRASKKYNRPNTKFITASILALPFNDGEFDVIVSFETLEHLAEHRQIMAELKRVLKKDGLLIISTPDKKEYSEKRNYQNQHHVKELMHEEFKELMQAFFINVRFYGQKSMAASTILPEDNMHWQEARQYSGDFADLTKDDLLKHPLYWIAVASDSSLDDIKPVIFSGADLLQNLKHAYEATWSYRIGRTITAPARFLKQIFKAH